MSLLFLGIDSKSIVVLAPHRTKAERDEGTRKKRLFPPRENRSEKSPEVVFEINSLTSNLKLTSRFHYVKFAEQRSDSECEIVQLTVQTKSSA
jgi:hypothetical protein